MYFVIGVTFIIIGAVIIHVNDDVYEKSERYDDNSDCDPKLNRNETCIIDFHIHEDMDSPIFLYYELKNFY